MKRIGPKIDPCGTPHSVLKKDDEVLFKKGHYQSHDKAKPCTYVQWSKRKFSFCKLNKTSMSSNET